ncbi:cell division protein ZipA [Acinetobacter radioresistens]|uniref:cell division protein ZipA C-terminal FtsZ-binding domain-containing protein n=1 Tax=Acinetobacter TaxID=469 RepID=UPI00047D56C9|nr:MULTISPECIES: cell division protein ZipA C-terminal FtsZ-binding domain-containing protein [Acinetobacter]MCU4499548.1 cell division protein ZipA [Acinetobacter radioresistens]MCU4517616.1 cell division protein ZipA [Acinetobacter radioresistens]MCU4594713.1 cell division protein ZipA [Acinetobacter radioresistens]NTY97082.1 cell division protein ZipA [Acinetobacter radioresistens]PKD80584.1 cell division protein ZipA [Acinetobacter radioresistens]
MEVTTMIGIIVAVIIILVGLRMMLKKPNTAPSLESELYIDPQSNKPVIPRHVRDQLQASESAVTPTVRKEPQLDQSSATQQSVPTAGQHSKQASEPEVSASQSVSTDKAETRAQPEAPAEAIALSETQAQVKKVEKTTSESTEVADGSEPKEPEFSLNPTIETAEIAEFDGESNILDVHLHEQQRCDDESALATAQQIIALNVYPNPRRALSGDKALKVLLKYGLRYGEMSCFHRYEKTEEQSPLMFSVLRITDEGPAGFDLESLSTEQVQGLAFFLALPNPNAITGFDMMTSIAGLIAREIDGKVYDEQNLEFTPQLKEHWRHQVIDYRPDHVSV